MSDEVVDDLWAAVRRLDDEYRLATAELRLDDAITAVMRQG
jgi:hypothetical protein